MRQDDLTTGWALSLMCERSPNAIATKYVSALGDGWLGRWRVPTDGAASTLLELYGTLRLRPSERACRVLILVLHK